LLGWHWFFRFRLPRKTYILRPNNRSCRLFPCQANLFLTQQQSRKTANTCIRHPHKNKNKIQKNHKSSVQGHQSYILTFLMPYYK